eukprot:CAMPEP_0198121790 /NCGR_PEP_ID=MMETSP1442-20131203/33080_2 /TAXON_ID= /ORGANISM="Craspedostauros australis, Strain CCMP3328" /LENGTH=173 /DNA_ID=CAMNT_0043780665 /DNA_START=161 /DNA_END=679 /DNA_ORIENTATION=-
MSISFVPTLKVCLSIACLFLLLGKSNAGPGAYMICQSGCNAVVVACYAGAGLTFGTVTGGLGAPAAALACNAALGTCMAACVAAAAPRPHKNQAPPTAATWHLKASLQVQDVLRATKQTDNPISIVRAMFVCGKLLWDSIEVGPSKTWCPPFGSLHLEAKSTARGSRPKARPS